VSWTWLDDGDAIIANKWSPSGMSPKIGPMLSVQVVKRPPPKRRKRGNRAAKPRFIKSRSDFILGGPCRNRTCGQRIKSPLLYLTELTARNQTTLILQRFVVKAFFGCGEKGLFSEHAVNQYARLKTAFMDSWHKKAMKSFLRSQGSRPGHFKALRTGDARDAHFITPAHLPDAPSFPGIGKIS
jgi:hypothetical protein